MGSEPRYWAFISYSHADQKAVARLHRLLESYRLPQNVAQELGLSSRRLFPFFRDRAELSASSDLTDSVRAALEQSRFMIIVCSANSAASRWVNAEVELFLEMGRRDRIVCCVLDDVRNMPAALLGMEPLAAHIVEDGWTDAKLKIISALLNCRFDDLKRRDIQSAHRKMTQIAAAATLGAAVMTGLAAYAFMARTEAEKQRTLAGFHQSQAENLVSFMVGDMRDRLEPIGRLDVLDAIGDEVMRYFSSQPLGSADPDMVLRQAEAMRQVGEIRVLQGRPADGRAAFEQAMDLLDDGLSRDTENEDLLFEISQLHFWIADAHLRQLDFTAAEARIERYREISERLLELDPSNPDYRMEVAWAYNNLGTLANRTGDITRAETLFGHTLELQQALVADYPDDLSYQSELANTVSWLASNESAKGALQTSLSLYRQELALREKVAERSDDPRERLLLARAHRWIGWTLSAMGRSEEALEPALAARVIYADLVVYDPENFDWALDYYRLLVQLARDEIHTGAHADALQNLRLVQHALEAFDDDGADFDLTRLRAAVGIALARYHLAESEPELASAAAGAAARDLHAHIHTSDDSSTPIQFAEAAYLLSEATKSSEIAARALGDLDQRGDKLPELRMLEMLLAFNAGDRARAQAILEETIESEFAPRAVRQTPVDRWLIESGDSQVH
jgi:tetratricopeptide (TPR) repeat protein